MIRSLFSRFAVSLSLTLLLSTALPGVVGAAPSGSCPTGGGVKGTSKTQVLGGVGETNSDCSGSSGQKAITGTIQILSYVIGIAAVIMVMVSAYKYITSNGDSGKISSAKNTLVYALIGIAVAALTPFLVRYVIGHAGG